MRTDEILKNLLDPNTYVQTAEEFWLTTDRLSRNGMGSRTPQNDTDQMIQDILFPVWHYLHDQEFYNDEAKFDAYFGEDTSHTLWAILSVDINNAEISIFLQIKISREVGALYKIYDKIVVELANPKCIEMLHKRLKQWLEQSKNDEITWGSLS